MNEKESIRKKLLKNMLVNFIVFIMLFLIFDLIIYNQVSSSLYKTIDQELMTAQERYINKNDSTSIKIFGDRERPNNVTVNNRSNPRLINIIRDNKGNITNGENIGAIYDIFENDIPFDKNNLMKIYTIELGGTYTYRGINLKTIQNGEEIYIQLLANVDGEKQTLKSVSNTLLLGTGILVTISIMISYILSKRTMSPLYEAYKKQTEFVQNASHELRTPLTIIQAKQELLLQEPESKIIDKSEEINLTLKETRRLTKMIKELMTLARADSNQYELNRELINIDELIKEVTIPYKDYAGIEEKKVILDLQYEKEISLDKNKISQLFIILLDNAIKYTTEGDTITIKTYSKDGKCNIEVQDTGIGISDEGLERIFDRFYREDKARSRETGGTGLGLSIAHTIVKAHGGSIKAMHNEPKGSIFWIKL